MVVAKTAGKPSRLYKRERESYYRCGRTASHSASMSASNITCHGPQQSCRFLFYMLGDYSIWYPLLQEISGVSPIFPAGLDNSAMSACDLRRKVLTTIRFDGLRKRHSVVTECIGRQICADIRRAQFIPGGKHIITQSKTGSLQLYSSVGDAVPLASSAPLPYAFMRISLSSRHETLATIL